MQSSTGYSEVYTPELVLHLTCSSVKENFTMNASNGIQLIQKRIEKASTPQPRVRGGLVSAVAKQPRVVYTRIVGELRTLAFN